jgi:predicted nuclease of predicted toxin-antitoxin system
VKSLRGDGHDVTFVVEQNPGASDDEVLLSAYNEGRILLTEDKDFEE